MRTIKVRGYGKVTAKADMCGIRINLRAKDKDYGKALEMSAEHTESLKAKLADAGFAEDDLKTENFNVFTEYDSVQDEKGFYQQVFSGYVCQYFFTLSFDFSNEKLGKALEAVSQANVSPDLNLSFYVKDPTAVQETVLQNACANALVKAKILAASSGVRLGDLQNIDYEFGNRNFASSTQFSMAEDCAMGANNMLRAKAVAISPKDIDITDSASFEWEIF
ncbi:MAG: SIMPL domain-containing protein [Clostridia bacterium]|nr:SIMPL domain-containing protein [Clostridia bacterium]